VLTSWCYAGQPGSAADWLQVPCGCQSSSMPSRLTGRDTAPASPPDGPIRRPRQEDPRPGTRHRRPLSPLTSEPPTAPNILIRMPPAIMAQVNSQPSSAVCWTAAALQPRRRTDARPSASCREAGTESPILNAPEEPSLRFNGTPYRRLHVHVVAEGWPLSVANRPAFHPRDRGLFRPANTAGAADETCLRWMLRRW
jgi:hypothetical protein